MEPPTFLGVAEDPRSDVAKALDYRHEEVAPEAAAPVTWTDKAPDQLRKFKDRDQNGSGMCMAQSGVKVLGIENVIEEAAFVELSALPVYQKRINQTTAGMWQQDLGDILSKPNACEESQVPSQRLTEAQANTPHIVLTPEQQKTADYYRANGYIFLPIDMDTIAGIVDQGKAVQIILFFLGSEYWKPEPTLDEPGLTKGDLRASHHGVAIVDRTLHNGQKSWVIEDSAGVTTGIGGEGRRIISEAWFKARCYGAMYLVYRKNDSTGPAKPHAHFNVAKPLTYGMMHDADVSVLQQILQYEGYLPTTLDNAPLPLGNMLSMTCAGLKKWQVAHDILDFANEPDIRKVRFGPKSIGLANTLYA